jgi:hypothetical protein
MAFPESHVVLSFARGRARQVARALVSLEFERDRNALHASRSFWFGRGRKRMLQREIDRRVHELIAISKQLDPDDPITIAIERVRACHGSRPVTFGHRAPNHAGEVAWTEALHDLERSLSARPSRSEGRSDQHFTNSKGARCSPARSPELKGQK